MGSGITTSMRTPEQIADTVKLVHETNLHSYTNKGRELERILKSDRSTSAFLKYLDRNGKGCCLILFLVTTQYKGKNEHLLNQALKETKFRYEPFPYQDSGTHFPWQEELHNMVTEILAISTVTSINAKKLEEFCFLNMTHELQGFIDSREFSTRFSHKIKHESSLRTVHEITRESKGKFKNVLIIDDSPQNSRQMSNELKANGHHVRQANHGWVGTYIATLHHFDVILVDLAMNTMNPYEVISHIRRNRHLVSGSLKSSTLFIGLKYSEYDSVMKSHDITFRINVETISSSNLYVNSTSKFLLDFNKSIIQNEEMLNGLDSNCDTCNSSMDSTMLVY